MAQRPVGAAHAGARGAHDDADGDEQHRRDDGGRGELLEPGHGRGFDLGQANGWDAAANAAAILRGAVAGHAGPSRRIPGSPATLCACPDRSPPCSCCSRPSSSAAPSSRAGRAPRSASTSAGKPSVIPVIVSSQQAVGPNRFVFSFLDPKTNLPAASPDRTASVAFIAPGQTEPGPAVPADVRVGDRGIARRLRGERRRSARPATGRPCSSPRRRTSPRRRSASGSRCSTRRTTVGIGQPAPVDDEPDRRGRRRRPREDLDRHPPRSGASTRRPSRTRWRRTSRSCSCSRRRRSARAPSAARRSTGSRRPRRPPQGRRVHQRRAVPARLHRRAGSSRSSTRTASSSRSTPSNQWGLVSEPWIFTVGADGIVKGSFEGVVGDARAQGGDRGDRRRLIRSARCGPCSAARAPARLPRQSGAPTAFGRAAAWPLWRARGRRAFTPAVGALVLHAGRADRRIAPRIVVVLRAGRPIQRFVRRSARWASSAPGGDGSRADGRASARRRVLEPVHDQVRAVLAEVHADRRRRGQVLGEVPGRELVAVLERADLERDLLRRRSCGA